MIFGLISRRGIFISKNALFSANNWLAILSYNSSSILEGCQKSKFGVEFYLIQ